MTPEKSALTARRQGERVCPQCGARFVCGTAAGTGSCWCAELPPLLPLPEKGEACFCPDCLRARIAAQEAGRAAGPCPNS